MSKTIKQCLNCNTQDYCRAHSKFYSSKQPKCEVDKKAHVFDNGFLSYGMLQVLFENQEEYFEDFENDICPFCKNKLVDTMITSEDYKIIKYVSNFNRDLLLAMIELRKKDVIEYELKMSQFRSQAEQQKQMKKAAKAASNTASNSVKCPYCHSTNTKKISGASKAGSLVLWGIFAAGKANKQWHCNNCNSDF